MKDDSFVYTYHTLSKHDPDRYAPGPGRLDWATQPEPFRSWVDAPRWNLPLLSGELPAAFDALSRPGAIPPAPLDLAHLAYLLQLALGLAAWKSYGGSRWALRCNPSSGNLHPTEGYVICPALPGLPGGVYHYQPHDHALEQRAACPFDGWNGRGVLLALTNLPWREAWKYGVRAFRYCQHDGGHAIAAFSYAAAALGWQATLLDHWGDDQVAALTGIHRADDFGNAEREEAEALVWIGLDRHRPTAETLLAALGRASWRGLANRLSPAHVEWPAIPEIAATTRKPVTLPSLSPSPPHYPPLPPGSLTPASRLFRQRRSAQSFDGHTAVSKAVFLRMLEALLPRPDSPPWNTLPWAPRVHPVLFVHRVAGVTPGLYALPRSEEAAAALRAALSPGWLWEPVVGCPAHLLLRLLLAGDLRDFAGAVSCHQDIAADSAFSLAMLAHFDAEIAAGTWVYRHLFWEAGLLGQILYLEAEAAGVRGTGIGCYFDDAVHEALGLAGTAFQDLYHFTVGGAVEDRRLTTEEPYGHLSTPRGRAADNARKWFR